MHRPWGFSIARLLIAAAVGVAAVGSLVIVLRTDTTGEKGSGLGKDFSYDLGELRRIDPKWIQYEEAGTIHTGLNEARGLALDANDRIHVAGDQAIRVFSTAGERLSEIKLAGQPSCVAVATDGLLYIGLSDHVEVYDAKGTRKAAWERLGEKAVITAVALSESNVFVAEAGKGVVLRYDTAGKLLGRIGLRDTERNIPGLLVPSPYFDVAVGPEGLLWATNPGRLRIEAYTFDGDLELSWGKPSFAIEGFCGCCNPTNFAILPDGRFATSEKGLPRVKIYSPEGQLESVVASPDRFARRAAGLDLAVDSTGRILVLDPMAKSVRAFTRIEKK